jgi:hypothetical protein
MQEILLDFRHPKRERFWRGDAGPSNCTPDGAGRPLLGGKSSRSAALYEEVPSSAANPAGDRAASDKWGTFRGAALSCVARVANQVQSKGRPDAGAPERPYRLDSRPRPPK